MKRGLVLLLLIGGVAAIVLLPQEPPIHAQDEGGAAGKALEKRIAKLEELVSFHSHERELNAISGRLDALDAALANSALTKPALTEPTPTARLPELPSARNESRELQREVQSLKDRLAKLEQVTSQLKKEDSNLRNALSRLESTVVRIDLRR
jgi:DNA repair exonuclease SbcCD ATPase subunit